MTIPPYIKSVQNVSITISTGSTGTATISSVTTANTILLYGSNTTSCSVANQSTGSVTLTNSTTVTATLGASVSNTTTIVCQVVEFYSGAVNVAVQYGTVTIGSSGTTATATLGTSVNTSFAALFPLGVQVGNGADTTYHNYSRASLAFTNGTTITATRGASGSTLVIGFCVIEFNSAMIQSIQHRSFSTTSSTATSITDTISSVNTTNTMILFYDSINSSSTGSTAFDANLSLYGQLTNSTTTTFTRTGNASLSCTICYDVVEFASGVLNSSVQRGTIALNNVTSNTATISSVSTSNAFVNCVGYNTGSTASNRAPKNTDIVFTNSTTLTAAVNTATAGIDTISYEVVEFASSSTSTADPIWFGMTF